MVDTGQSFLINSLQHNNNIHQVRRNSLQTLSPGCWKIPEKYKELYNSKNKIEGTALFFARDIRKIPPYIVSTMFYNNIIYEDNVIVSITRLEDPYGVGYSFKETPAQGLRIFEIRLGYMEVGGCRKVIEDIRDR